MAEPGCQTVQKAHRGRVAPEPGSNWAGFSARVRADPVPTDEPEKVASLPNQPSRSNDHRLQPFATGVRSKPGAVYESEWLVRSASAE